MIDWRLPGIIDALFLAVDAFFIAAGHYYYKLVTHLGLWLSHIDYVNRIVIVQYRGNYGYNGPRTRWLLSTTRCV